MRVTATSFVYQVKSPFVYVQSFVGVKLVSYRSYRSYQGVYIVKVSCNRYFLLQLSHDQPISEWLQHLRSHFTLEAAIFSHDVIHMHISLVLNTGLPPFVEFPSLLKMNIDMSISDLLAVRIKKTLLD